MTREQVVEIPVTLRDRAADELERLVAFEDAVRAVLQDEDGEWRELNSCADAVQDISLALSELDADRAAAKGVAKE